MMHLNPEHISNCTKEISRWSKAIRLIHALEHNLPPEGFPEPDSIEPARKPYDLEIKWNAHNPKHCANLRKRIMTVLNMESQWKPRIDGRSLCASGRIRVGTKTTMNVLLVVERQDIRDNGYCYQ